MALVKNTALNLLGLGLPLVVAVFAIPLLIGQMGAERFGLLTLIWALVGYFGLFDLGLGRALTQQLAGAYAVGDEARAQRLVSTGLALMAFVGCVAGLLLYAAGPAIVRMLKTTADISEVLDAVQVMAWSIPAIVVTAGLKGILEARQQFFIVNAIRLPMGLLTFLGPLAICVLFAPRLDWIALTLFGGRLLALAAHAFYAVRQDARWSLQAPSRQELGPLCKSGGWIAVSNVLSPLMGYLDRFILGMHASGQVVTHYATPQEIVTKIWIVPGALTAALFPTVARNAQHDAPAQRQILGQSIALIFLSLQPITLAIALFAPEVLGLWLGSDIAEQSSLPLRVFAFGMLVNSVATVPFTLLQGTGHARATGLIHALQLPLYGLGLWWAIGKWSLAGALAIWMLRVAVDTWLMFYCGAQVLNIRLRSAMTTFQLGTCLLGLCAFAGVWITSLSGRLGWYLVTTAALSFLVWPFLRSLRRGV